MKSFASPATGPPLATYCVLNIYLKHLRFSKETQTTPIAYSQLILQTTRPDPQLE